MGFIPFQLRMVGQELVFLPDGIVVKDGTGLALVSYQAFTCEASFTRFIEEEVLQQDALVVDSTWKHPNQDGTPDLRFNNNIRLPICKYGQVSYQFGASPGGYLQTSNPSAGNHFVRAFEPMRSIGQVHSEIEIDSARDQTLLQFVLAAILVPLLRRVSWFDRQMAIFSTDPGGWFHQACRGFVGLALIALLIVSFYVIGKMVYWTSWPVLLRYADFPPAAKADILTVGETAK